MGDSVERDPAAVGGGYARYVLVVLVLVYIFNFIDRQILSILAEDIKADLGITDAQIGFLFGTAFAVFYAVFGIPLGKLADLWTRRSLIATGLVFWSAMTALSATARGFGSLALFRFGVGIGEASASPAAFSLLSDWFPPRMRATVLAIYSSGVYIGAGIGVFLGGTILDAWNGAWPDRADAPLGLAGWQAAFLAVGLPGLAMAVWVRTLREPLRGLSEGITSPVHPHPFRAAAEELLTLLPPLTLYGLHRAGAGARAIALNLAGAALLAGLVVALIGWLGDPAQWIALGLGVYAAGSWIQGLTRRDPVAFRMVFGSRAFLLCGLGFPVISFVTYGVGFWAAPFFIRVHGATASEVGLWLGLGAALGGWIGVTFGGWLADRLRRHTPLGRLWIGVAVPVLAVPVGLFQLSTESAALAYAASFVFSIVSPMWVGPAASTFSDLVLPRMRALAAAVYLLVNTFIGLGLGPYVIGTISDHLAAGGAPPGEALRQAMMLALSVLAVSMASLALAMRWLPGEEASRLDRARAAGEPAAGPAGVAAGRPA